MRINFSHATYEEADLRVRNLKQCKGLSALHSTVTSILNIRILLVVVVFCFFYAEISNCDFVEPGSRAEYSRCDVRYSRT